MQGCGWRGASDSSFAGTRPGVLVENFGGYKRAGAPKDPGLVVGMPCDRLVGVDTELFLRIGAHAHQLVELV